MFIFYIKDSMLQDSACSVPVKEGWRGMPGTLLVRAAGHVLGAADCRVRPRLFLGHLPVRRCHLPPLLLNLLLIYPLELVSVSLGAS